MDETILRDRIRQRLRTIIMDEGMVSVDVKQATDADGNMTVNVAPVIGEIRMDDKLASTIAQAVAEALVDFLIKEVVVTVENGASGGDTLTGHLE